MIEFNSSNVIAAFIKQLLHTFNLPTSPVYIKDETWLAKDKLYLKDSQVCVCTDSSAPAFKMLFPFIYNKEHLNYTKTLRFNSVTYDSHTHEYLGEYLRFMRDYHKLDLMSMYNCFSDNIYKISPIRITVDNTTKKFETDNNFKIYSFPVKLGKKYTIAISSGIPYDIFCGLCGKEFISTYMTEYGGGCNIEAKTYQKVGGSYFDKPFIYDKLTNETLKNYPELIHMENCLRMFIVIPFDNTSSIVVLEGDYSGFNDKSFALTEVDSQVVSTTLPSNNQSFINFNKDLVENQPRLISALQLLSINSNVSHPFADRLIEYLCKNTIDNTDKIDDNIKRVQSTLLYRHSKGLPGINSLKGDYGIWNDTYKYVLYAAAQRDKGENLLSQLFDVLGYVDKDIEKMLLPDEVDIYKDE